MLKHKIKILPIIIWMLVSVINGQNVKFKKLYIKEKPYVGNVLKVYQDKKGYIWLCNEDGLRKYDGTKLTEYRHNASDPESISDDLVTTMEEDSYGNLWIGTANGINKYIPEDGSFKRYYLSPKDPDFIQNNNVVWIETDSKGLMWILSHGGIYVHYAGSELFRRFDIPTQEAGDKLDDIRSYMEDHEGNYWFGTAHGLYKYIPSQGCAISFKNNPDNPASLGNNFVNYLVEDKDFNIWIGTYGGLDVYSPNDGNFIHFKYDPNKINSLSNNQIRCILPDSDGNFWISTTNGLNYCEWDNENKKIKIRNYWHVPGDELSISSNSLSGITFDNEGRLWIGSRFGGVDIYDNKNKNFEHFKFDLRDKNSLSHNNVSCFTQDKKGYVWVATDGGGLNMMDPVKNAFKRFYHDEGNPNSISNDKVLAVLNDSKNNLWVGYWDGGLDIYDANGNKLRHLQSEPDNKNSIKSNNIFYLYEDSRKNIWICHWEDGITLYERKSDKFIRYPNEKQPAKGLAGKTVRIAYEDSEGIIWLGSENYGLFSYDYKNDKFKRYVKNDKDNVSISHNTVAAALEDKNGRLWFGTIGGGLNLYDKKANSFKYFTTNDGLADNFICGIIEDGSGTLWLSTHKGLVKFMYGPKADTIVKCKNYDVNDGLQDNQFNMWAYFKDKNGKMYFGGINGITRFCAKDITENTTPPTVKITDLYIFNDRVTSKTRNVNLSKPIDELDEIKLSYKHSMISFEFAALNYTDPVKNQYSYMLEGFDKNWHFNGNYNRATYTNLDPGEYIFKVIASNNDGVWNNQGVSLNVIISPPYWQTAWFKILMALTIVIVVYLAYLYRVKNLKKEIDMRREYEKVLERAKQKAEESDKLKSSILDNISHEIRTPINGIIGFTELLIKPRLSEEKKKGYIKTIKSRYSELIHTMDSILDLSVLVSGGIKINEQIASLGSVITDIVQISRNRIEEDKKNLNVEVHGNGETKDLIIKADIVKLRTILWHLTDNAIKFSKDGVIKIGYEINPGVIKFSITDPGIGIPENKKDIIFEQFRQSDLGINRRFGGIGLGLSLCKGFLDILGGDIWFETKEYKGSVFYFTFPYKLTKVESNKN